MIDSTIVLGAFGRCTHHPFLQSCLRRSTYIGVWTLVHTISSWQTCGFSNSAWNEGAAAQNARGTKVHTPDASSYSCATEVLNLKALSNTLSHSFRTFSCPELPVAGVAQTGHDIAFIVEMAIDLGQVDRHVWMSLL